MGAHLVKSSCDKLVYAHERVGFEASRVRVVVGGRVEGVPLAQHKELRVDLQGFVGSSHKERGGDIFTGQGWNLQYQGESGEALA